MEEFDHRGSQDIPVFLVKEGMNTIRSWSFIRFERKNSSFDFILSRNDSQVRMVLSINGAPKERVELKGQR